MGVCIRIPKVKDFDPYYWRISRFQHAFLELVRAWSEEGYVELAESDDSFCWWGNVLLFDCDQTQFLWDQKLQKTWSGRRSADLTLFGNEKPFCDFFHRSWIYWSYHPRKLDQYVQSTESKSFRERNLDIIFAGRAENNCQEIYRRQSDSFISYIHEVVSKKFRIEVHALMRDERGNIPKYVWTPEEYLSAVSSSRFGLSIRGNGPSCYREIEYLALGTVPILTPGCVMHYRNQLEEGLHYFEVEEPNDIIQLLSTITEEDWKRCSEAGRAWYWMNASLEGSFKTTQLIIHDFYKQKEKLRICRHIFCFMSTSYGDWLSTWEQMDARYEEIGERLPKIWILHASDNREKVPKKYRERIHRVGEMGSWKNTTVIPPTLPTFGFQDHEYALFLGSPCIMMSCPILREDEHTWWLGDENYGILEHVRGEWKAQCPGGYLERCLWYDCWTDDTIYVPFCINLEVLYNLRSPCRDWFLEQGDPFYRQLAYEAKLRIEDVHVLWSKVEMKRNDAFLWENVEWSNEEWNKFSKWIHSGMIMTGERCHWKQPSHFPFDGVYRVAWIWDGSRSAEDYGAVPPSDDIYYVELSESSHVVLPLMWVEEARLQQGQYDLCCQKAFHRYFLKQLWLGEKSLQLSQLENLRNIGEVWKLEGMSECKEVTYFRLRLNIQGRLYELTRKLRFEAFLMSNYVFLIN